MRRLDLDVIFRLFLGSARLQKKRAALTIAAIAWGTVTILLLMSFGEGLKRQMRQNSNGMGRNLSINWPGSTSKPYKGLPEGRPIRPRLDDVDFLRARMPDVLIWGEMHNGRTAFTYGRKTVNNRLVGAHWEYGDARRHYAKPGGRFLTARDEAEQRRVVFLGDEVASDIFGKEDPVGKTILINNSPFMVVGVMQRKVQSGSYGSPDRMKATIPITTFKALFGRDRLWVLVLNTKTPDEMEGALTKMRELLGRKLGFVPDDERVFGVWNTVNGQKIEDNIFLGLQIFFGVIGGLTLIIGAVGVANIMYAVVKERTREIGVKMAMGARRSWITGPFLLEGVSYTLVGGLFGAVIAVVIVTLLGFIPQEGNDVLEFLGKPTLSWPIGLATVGILGAAGLLAGYFPARRAASIDPASTLRYE
jgi:putative ABC transport system permease protein